MRTLILGTAGHIDHGKTSLVKALTGVDTDRLPEEKARGITIDLGFAHLDLGDVRLGIVDVPGHERFIRNMLAGATGIDLALLVVAADDSVMPQTREHLEILSFLGLKHGVIALTKADLVDDTTREVAILEVRELVAGTFLADAPIIATSATTGHGIDELKAALLAAAEKVEAVELSPFRLAIDRVFVRQGYGTVVTGSVVNGRVKSGDEIEWHHDGQVERVRVRGLAHHGEAVEMIERGQRAAINLAGVPHESVHRGQELVCRDYLAPTTLLTVRLRVSAQGRSLKHRLPVRVHIGTAEVMGKLALLDAETAEPGQRVFAQIFLNESVTAVWGQPFVIRDSGAETTLGGGSVLQPYPRKHKRRDVDVLHHLEQLGDTSERIRLAAAAWLEDLDGIGFCDEPVLAGVSVSTVFSGDMINDGSLIEFDWHPTVLCHPERVRAAETRIVNALAALHRSQPLMTHHDRRQFVKSQTLQVHDTMINALIDRLMTSRTIIGNEQFIALSTFKPKLSVNQQKLKDRIVDAHRVAGFNPPEPASFENLAQGNKSALKDIYEVAVAEGLLAKVTTEIYLHAETDAKLKSIILEKMTDTGATVAEIRDWLGTTRKFAVPLCEYLDRIGVTQRRGDVRQLKQNLAPSR